MPDSARFWDARADGYAKRPIRDLRSYEKTLELSRGHLSPGDRVLEVGCGTGSTALLLAPSVEQIVATDVSSRMIEIARSKALSQQVPNVRFERGTPFDPPLEGEPFDVVTAFNFLHLLEDIPAVLRCLHDRLKPGGLFISKTPCLAEQSRLWAVLLTLLKLVGVAPTVRCLRVAELEGLIGDAGFSILETGSYPASPPSRYVVARRS